MYNISDLIPNIVFFLLFMHSFFYLLFPKMLIQPFFKICGIISSDLTPSSSLLPPQHLSALYTSSRWGNQSACYSLISDTIQLLILARVCQCRGQCYHIARLPGRVSELLSRNHNQMLTWLFQSYCHKQTDWRKMDGQADRLSFIHQVLSRQI